MAVQPTPLQFQATPKNEKTAIALTSSELAERMLHRRAVEAMIWGMPAVNFELLYQATAQAKGAWNQIVF